MNGYSKIRFVSTTKSKSIDLSDLFSPPQTPKPIINLPPISKPIHTIKGEANLNNTQTTHYPISSQEHEGDGGEKFGEILSRNCSNTSQRFKGGEKQVSTPTTTSAAATLQAAVKRAFSMRRSCSVSEGYSRIYDQCDEAPVWSPSNCNDVTTMHTTRSNKRKKKKRGSRIIKACKTLFGF